MLSMSRLADDLVALARRITEELQPPPVENVIIPAADGGPDHRGAFCAVQLSDGSSGLSYVLLEDALASLQALDASSLSGQPALELARHLPGGDPARRCLALAAFNALARHLLERAGFLPDFATNSVGSLELDGSDRLGMVGFFPPLVRRALDQGIALTVLELRSELVQEQPGMSVTLDPSRLAECSKIICTSTTLLNDSLDAVLAHARSCREFVIVGPSAVCVPDPLFARGVTGVGGAWVTNPTALAERIRGGRPWGDAARKFSLRNDGAWPGVEELLRRSRR